MQLNHLQQLKTKTLVTSSSIILCKYCSYEKCVTTHLFKQLLNGEQGLHGVYKEEGKINWIVLDHSGL